MKNHFFQFHDPYLLFFLLVLPWIYFLYQRRQGLLHVRYSSIELFHGLHQSLKQKLSFVPAALRVLALLFLIIGIARPQLANKTTEVLSEGIDIMLTIDTSESMRALDFELDSQRVDRLAVVKKVVQNFISHRAFDRIGMVVFGDDAYTQCPLTTDQSTLQSFLQWIQIGIVGKQTALGNAVALSVKRLKDQKAKSKIIILLTDGRNTSGEIKPKKAAEISKKYGIKIYTIGVGSNGLVPFPVPTPFGTQLVQQRVDLDENTLREMAQMTGGQYYRATATSELAHIYETIDKLEKTEIKTKEYLDVIELYPWFIVISLFFLILEIILSQTYFQRIP